MNKIIAAAKNWYGGLSPWAKGAVTVAEGAALGFVGQYAQGWVNGQPLCLSLPCLKSVGIGLVFAVGIAVRNYLKQSPFAPK